MKANELMIGDWVLWYGNDGNIYPFKVITLCALEELPCKPIPITEEILKANGWTCDYGDAYQYARHKDVFFDIYNGVASYEDKDISL